MNEDSEVVKLIMLINEKIQKNKILKTVMDGNCQGVMSLIDIYGVEMVSLAETIVEIYKLLYTAIEKLEAVEKYRGKE